MSFFDKFRGMAQGMLGGEGTRKPRNGFLNLMKKAGAVQDDQGQWSKSISKGYNEAQGDSSNWMNKQNSGPVTGRRFER